MEGRLTEDRATIISNALKTDGTFVGSPEWLQSHYIEPWEWEAYLEYPVRLAQMYEWQEMNKDVGSVDVALTFTKHSGKVGSNEETWSVFAPQSDTAKILMVAETGEVTATLTPKQMPLPIDDGMVILDANTGEVVSG